MYSLDDFDYHLPDKLIAREPLPRRDAARMLVVHRDTGTWEHRHVTDLPEYLQPNDLLVMNDTRVLPARLTGVRTATGGRWEGLFLHANDEGTWDIIGQTRGRIQPGETITLQPVHPDRNPGGKELQLQWLAEKPDGVRCVQPNSDLPVEELLAVFGTMPLPPYIGRQAANTMDWERYQTVFARTPGAVAAPTAGLHLTQELLAQIRDQGVHTDYVTLHVGIGTFRPVQVQDLNTHHMHEEWCELTPPVAENITITKQQSARVVAVGTTTVRTLESAAKTGTLTPFCGPTDLFLRPGSRFHVIDALFTNFHLPKSTLLMLISAFADVELIRAAYAAAIAERYRFFSYGDAMLIV